MENQKPQHISKFKKGDIITRVENYEYFPQLDYISGKIKMEPAISPIATGIGIAYEYIGVLNGRILVKYAQNWDVHKKGDAADRYSYPRYQNGWAKYIDPSSLNNPVKEKLNPMEQILKDYNSNNRRQKEN